MAPQNPPPGQQDCYYQNQPPAYQQHPGLGPNPHQNQGYGGHRPSHWVPFTQPRRERRRWDRTTSILRQFSMALPVVMIIVVAYMYIREAHERSSMDFPPSAPIWTPLYTILPLAVTTLVWTCVVTGIQRRSERTGGPSTPFYLFAVELVFAIGSIACFAIMVWYLNKTWDSRSQPLFNSLVSVTLAIITGLRIRAERKATAQQAESYIVH
ncbi:unnamed protein product [Parascedosporium putredinis]|uniref:Uncharacterized protein n=1 Tax=Parascedosporium putredinis TaxID=1442378 RepID=A0A9P1H0T0_9PEZI|nr:unnamed protein product [Parascedosporium putredinis]CAI7994241.1 unnamed protein product [Parascedosporium putredinis]